MKSKTHKICVFLLSVFCVSRALAAEGWVSYVNERFGFGVEVPPGFQAQEAPANDDGRSFLSQDGATSLLVFGGYNVLDQSPETLLADLVRDDSMFTSVTAQRLGRDWVAVSGTLGDTIVYQKTLFSCAGAVLNSLVLTYPAASRSQVDPIVARLSESLKAGRGFGTPEDC